MTLDWTRAALERLFPRGRLLLYSGSPIVDGRDWLKSELSDLAERAGCRMDYRELDPDVFSATLLHPAYWRVERIAAFGAVFERQV